MKKVLAVLLAAMMLGGVLAVAAGAIGNPGWVYDKDGPTAARWNPVTGEESSDLVPLPLLGGKDITELTQAELRRLQLENEAALLWNIDCVRHYEYIVETKTLVDDFGDPILSEGGIPTYLLPEISFIRALGGARCLLSSL